MTIDLHHSLAAALVGLLAGMHAAIWGMYKDSVYEGFAPASFVRSMLLGCVSAVALQAALHLDLPHPGSIAMLFGLAYAAERTVVEMWKAFIRREDQSKYFIPMQFSIGGEPVASHTVRIVVGVLCIAALAGCFAMIAQLDGSIGSLPRPVQGALVGLAVGAMIAIGGGWKDAPKEGFDPIKFFRSPIVTLSCAFVLCWIADSYLLLAIAAMGYERAVVETYKTFLAAKPPGKFSGKPITHPHMYLQRRSWVPAYVAICLAVSACATLGISERALNTAATSSSTRPTR